MNVWDNEEKVLWGLWLYDYQASPKMSSGKIVHSVIITIKDRELSN